MGKILLYRDSPNKIIVPQYGLGNEKHDYGKGLYLTEDLELAKEWAVCIPNEKSVGQKMRELVDSDANKVTNVFSTLL